MKYAGIGSRQTPPDVLVFMSQIAIDLVHKGWVLRSGHADGADMAFERGCEAVCKHDNVSCDHKEIFLPWRGFNYSRSRFWYVSPAAQEVAASVHPAWHRCNKTAKFFHGRNAYQILGYNLDDPVDLVVCWTKNGVATGGTATAINLAKRNNIRVVNLAVESLELSQLLR